MKRPCFPKLKTSCLFAVGSVGSSRLILTVREGKGSVRFIAIILHCQSVIFFYYFIFFNDKCKQKEIEFIATGLPLRHLQVTFHLIYITGTLEVR